MYKTLSMINFVFMLLSINALCQIPIRTVNKTSNDVNSDLYYDSTINFLGDQVNLYINQTLILKGKNIKLREYGYENFYNKLPKKKSSYNSLKYDELAGKSFLVKEVIKSSSSKDSYLGKEYYLKLFDLKDKKILFYKYDSEYKHSFPFIVLGYFKKLERDYLGKKFLLRKLVNKPSETKTKVGDTLECKSFFIEDKYFGFVVELVRNDGETVVTSVDIMLNNYNFLFPLDFYEKFENKFGIYWEPALNKRVKIGMTKEIAEFTWGKPKEINRTIVSGNIHEQWVYGLKSYLYFEGDTLTSIQN